MNLFTEYTKEETKFLLEVGEKSFPRERIKLFDGVDLTSMVHFERKLLKKDLIKEYEFVYVKSGKIGVVYNGRVVRVLKKGDCFGVMNKFLDEEYYLLAMEDSVVLFFGVDKKKEIYENILKCIAEKLKGKVVL